MMNRFRQVSHYAWHQSKDIAKAEKKGVSYRIKIYCDMMRCFLKYRMWTNQYVKENFHKKTTEEREGIGAKYLESGKIRDAWQKDFRENREFLIKYMNIKYERSSLRGKRNKAYSKRYHAGKNFAVEYDVNISRQHYLEGSISIGSNVLIAKHVFIDYSGDLVIHDDVKISDGVNIETHSHLGFTSTGSGIAKKESLEIYEHVNLGAKAFITESCHKIGRYAKIGAGAVVRGNVPPYSIVMGNPAKIIGFLYSPEEMVTFEEKKYSTEYRTPVEKYKHYYDLYYKSRKSEIKSFIKL